MANSIIESFFALGDKATGGNPKRKMDFDYYLMWVIFLAFFLMFAANLWQFIQFQQLTSLTWILLGLAMMWFQYGSLKQIWLVRKMMNQKPEDKKQESIESVDDMLKQFGGKQ